MNEQEKKAIEKLKKIIEDTIKANECGLSNNDFKEEIEVYDTVLNLITKLQKEIQDYKYLYEQALDNTLKADKENLKLKKQINLMAERIEWLCKSNGILLDKEHDENFTQEDVKQYFERKVEDVKD